MSKINPRKVGKDLSFENMVKQVPAGIIVFRGPSFIVEMANAAYLQIVDRKEQDFIGKPLFEGLPEIKEAVAPLLTNVYDTGIPYHGTEFEVRILRHGKKEAAWFNFVYQPLREQDGSINGVVVIANEVTEQVIAKHILAESERQFRNVVTHSPIAMAIFRGEEWVIEMANNILLKTLWKRELHEVQGKKLLEVFPELKGQQFPLLLQKVWETGITYKENEAIAYIHSNDGTNKYYLDFEYAPLFAQDKTVSGIMVTVSDVTEKVAAREKTEETKERLRLAIEGSRMATYDLNLRTSGIIHSPRLAVIFGHEESRSLLHRELRSLIHPDDLSVVEESFKEALQTSIYHYEVRVVWPDASIHWIRTRGKVLFDENTAPHRMLGTVIDITESKEAEEKKFAELKTAEEALERKVQERTKELKQANEELVRINQELSSFAYVSSHDLQEPLRKIQTFATRIVDTEKDNLSEKGKDYLNRLENAATRMRLLIQDILAYSRTNHTEKIIETVDLNELLSEVLEELKESMLEKNAVLESESLPSVSGIRFQLYQLFMNIISNAIKFARQDKPVHINLRSSLIKGQDVPDENADPAKTYHLLSISDNGIGFAQEFNKRIFEVFQRLHGKSAYAGTGIGLAIVKKIITNHGGIILAFGKEDIGARFDIYLPVSGTDSPHPLPTF